MPFHRTITNNVLRLRQEFLSCPVFVLSLQSVAFNMSIALHAATQAKQLLALAAAVLLSSSESHPMDHDNSREP
jgi:hypothetical protein